MRIFSRGTLRDFWLNHADSEQQLKAWYEEATNDNWNSPADIKRKYPSASILPDNRVVFNIKGNSYRLIVKFNFEKQWAFIRFLGTHAAYDKIDANTI